MSTHGRWSGGSTSFVALETKAFRTLFVSGLLVFLAVQSQQVARGWLAVELSGTNSGLGGVYLGFGIPLLLVAPVAGVLADRLSKRTVIVVAQVLIASGAIWVAAADLTGHLRYWMLVATAVLNGSGAAMLHPARIALTGEVVERPVFANAVALSQMSMSGTQIVGPTLAGVLIGVHGVGAPGVYVLSAALCAVATVVSLTLPTSPPNHSTRRPLADWTDGLRYVTRRQPAVLVLLVLYSIVLLVGFQYLVLLPNITATVFDRGSGGYGLLSAFNAIGAVAMSLYVAGRIGASDLRRLQVRFGIAFALALVTFAVTPSFAIALPAVAAVGAAAAGFQAASSSLILTQSDSAYHGRVQSLVVMGSSGFGLAALPVGLLADAIGLRTVMVAVGVTCLATITVYAQGAWSRTPAAELRPRAR